MRIVPLLGLLISLTLRAQVWEPLNGPHMTVVTLVETSSSGFVFINSIEGVFRSSDNGDTWVPMSIGPPGNSISAIAIAPNNHLFALGDSIYKSEDDGSTWAGLVTWPLPYAPSCLMVDTTGVLFAGTSGLVMFRSYDEGDTWISSVSPGFINMLVDGPSDTLYARTSTGLGGDLLRSADGGATWLDLNTPFPWTIGVSDSGHVFASMNGVLSRSTNGGADWTPLNLGGVGDLVWNSGDRIFAATGMQGVFNSLDNGDTWLPANTGLYSWHVNAVAVNDSNYAFAATMGGLFRSNNGGASWVRVYSGSSGSQIHGLITNTNNDYFAGVSPVGVFRSQDQGNSWQAANTGMESSTVRSLAMSASGHLFAGAVNLDGRRGVFRSMDNGDTWDLVLDSTEVLALTITSQGDIFASMVAQPGLPSIMRSSDNGTTWADVSDDLQCISFRSLAVAANDMVLAGAEICTPPVFASLDNGLSWSPSATGLDVDPTISVIEVGPNNTIFTAQLGQAPHVFRSTDNALTWEPAVNGLTALNVQAIECLPTPGLVLAGTSFGAFITGSNGHEWWPFNDGLTNPYITSFATDQNGLVLAGTTGGGVFRASLPVSVPEVDANAFTLEQNVPNPCDGNTTIAYTLSTSSHVQLVLLDAHGRTVAQLVNAEQPPGRRTVEVATARLSPGLYAYSLTVDGQRMTKRMMVVH